MFEKLTLLEHKYYSINTDLEINTIKSLYDGLRVENVLLVLRTSKSEFPYLSSAGNTWTNYYYSFSLFTDNFAPISKIERNSWSIRFSDPLKNTNDYKWFTVLINDPKGDSIERRGFSSDEPVGILKALELFHQASSYKDINEFNLYTELERLKVENVNLKQKNELLEQRIEEINV